MDLEIPPGELFGLLGVNGAGKTTTIKMLSTLLEPTSGDRTLYWKLTVRENLRFYGAMYGMAGRTVEARIPEVLRTVGLEERADSRVEKLSTGLRQRAALARALLHDPPVLILDEPTIGLDVHFARSLRLVMRRLADEGRTVLLTTHNLQEAEALCDRVGVIHKGRLAAWTPRTGLGGATPGRRSSS